jgi:flagellar motility protein MotE (MotC chaperone)
MVLDRAEERAAEREERMRTLELEMEEKMREREERRDMQLMSMFSGLLQQIGPRPPFL